MTARWPRLSPVTSASGPADATERPQSVADPGGRASGTWIDSEALDEDWPEPKPVRHRPLWLTAGVPVVVLGLLVTLVWTAGGFEKRSNNNILVEPGTLIESGPFEFTFTGATAQKNRDEGWTVRVIGSGRTTGESTERPKTGESGAFVARDPKSREIQVPLTPEIGEKVTIESRPVTNHFTPGLPMVPITLELEFTDAYEPTANLMFLVLQQEFVDNTLTKTGEQTWNIVNSGSVMDLPVTLLPPEE